MSLNKTHLKKRVLAELNKHGNKSRAAKRVGINRRTIWRWTQDDEAFGKSAAIAIEHATS